MKNLGDEILRFPASMYQAPVNRDMHHDVGPPWTGQDLDHLKVAGLPEETSSMFVDMPGTCYRQCLDGGGAEIQGIQEAEDRNHIW